ncbi:hypothetical protein AA309_01020 [Microvirga vignae]|uniref:Uncharacterized protein n=1 Tax=Microvirga vignae TaxID=1225564 RepID=A0A0H1RIG8_9HYPH|nr:hypothetical protein [Microvirga vignae]KLK94819.1 hypothetical protein AA309_01020 [Microvirga vignae]
MDQPCSIVADWLSKFHTWPELIQALWLVAIPATVLGVTWIVVRGLTRILAITSRGQLIYGVYQDEQGHWMIYRHDRKPQEIDWTNPPELIGHDRVTQGVIRRPEE